MASGNTVVSVTIRAIDRASSVFRKLASYAGSFAKGLLAQGANLNGWVSMIQGAVGRVAGIFQWLWGAIRESFKFETLTGQFRTLLGSMDGARERMAMLARVAEETPFDLEGVAKANRTLTVMSGDALGTREALLLVGDTAAATGASIEELAFWVGRAYAMIKGGQPFGEAALRLQELGVLAPEVRRKMEELQASGAGSAEVWQVLQEHLQTFSGAMAHLSQSGDGLTATLGDTWSAAVRQFGDAFQGAAKEGIEFLINLLKKLQADGSIQRWAEAAVKALTPVKNLIQSVLGGDEGDRGEALKAAWDYVKSVANYVKTVLVAAFDYAGTKILSAALGAAAEIAEVFGREELAAFNRRRAEATNDLARLTFQRTMLEAGERMKEAGAELSRVTAALGERARARVAQAAAAAEEAAPLPDDGGLNKASDDLKKADEARQQANGEKEKAAKAEEAAARARQEAAEAQAKAAEATKALAKDVERAAKDEAEAAERAAEAARKRAEAAEELEKEWWARLNDSDFDKQKRDEARAAKNEDDRRKRLRRRADRLIARFATLRDPDALLRNDFDVGRLTHSERALREWFLADISLKNAKEAQDAAKEAAEAAVDELRQIREDLQRLLTQA